MSDPKKGAPPDAETPPDTAPPAAPEEATGLEEVPPTLEALRKERDELRDQLLRRRADFENYRKRVERDRQHAGQEALVGLLRDLIPTLDNLERALSVAGDEASLRTGVELTLRELAALLLRHGLTVADPAGQAFDPERHQALLHEFVHGVDEGQVVEVFRKGYSLRDRLLRPALVKVAKGEKEPGSDSGGVH